MLAALSVIALVAVASCGDDDDTSNATTTPGTVATGSTPGTDAADDTTTTEGDSAETTTADTTEETTAETKTTDAPSDTLPGLRVAEDEGEPVKGGTLVYGLEADSANGWVPYRTSCATSCYVNLEAVSDPLFGVADDNSIVPLLAKSVDHNADYTEWTITVRDGIKFHDGTPLDGAAVKFNIDTCVYAPLTASAYASIGETTASGQTVTIKTRGGTPWVALPAYYAGGQCSYMFSPTWMKTLPDVPQRTEGLPIYDAALAATPADGDPAKPVGLGAFKFESYTPGNGNAFRAVRNDDYWRGPNGVTGEDLPYLDAVEGVVAVDEDGRSNGLRGGQFDIMMTANGDTISQFLDDDSFKLNTSARNGETAYTMLNVAEGPETDPEGKNAASPLLNVNCRRALAAAIDTKRLSEERSAGLAPPANGPFPPGSVGYLADTGYPAFDQAKANELLDTCLGELGVPKIEFSFNTTNDPFNVETNTLVISMWTEAFGDKVSAKITPIEQGQYIGLALTGAFQAFAWRNHSGIDPDQQRVWWQSSASAPIGALAINFGRFKDADIDAALDTIKTTADPAARKAAAEAINKRFGDQVYNLWNLWVLWGIITQPYVNGVNTNTLPDGTEGIGLAGAGRHGLVQMWCTDGKCE